MPPFPDAPGVAAGAQVPRAGIRTGHRAPGTGPGHAGQQMRLQLPLPEGLCTVSWEPHFK